MKSMLLAWGFADSTAWFEMKMVIFFLLFADRRITIWKHSQRSVLVLKY